MHQANNVSFYFDSIKRLSLEKKKLNKRYLCFSDIVFQTICY